MARRVKVRTADTYQYDIETLMRLRTAILLDSSLPKALSAPALKAIQELEASLVKLVGHLSK